MDKILSIDELAKANNTTPTAVRLYIGKRLLEPMRVGRMFCFSEDATDALNNKHRAKRLGFGLEKNMTVQCGHDDAALKRAMNRFEHLIPAAAIEIAGLRRRFSQTPIGSRNEEIAS